MQKGYRYRFLKFFIIFMIVAWMGMVVYDFYRTKNNNEPLFCISNEVEERVDGKIYICNGIGYKYYNYVMESYNLKKFEPFWIKSSEANKNE